MRVMPKGSIAGLPPAAPADQVTLKVRCFDGTHHDVALPASAQVEQLLQQLQAKTSVHTACMKLVFAGRQLTPERTLAECNVKSNCTLFLMVKPVFPETLGPFTMTEVDWRTADFQLMPWGPEVQVDGMMWVMEAPAVARHGARGNCEFPLIGQFSPTHPVTLTAQEKEAVGIPATAVEFVWSYPAVGWDGGGNTSAAASFLSVGGFVYFDAQHQIVKATTPMPRDDSTGGLQFGKSAAWDPEWTKALMLNGRFQPITIKPLNDVGAFHFCWLRPGEKIRNHLGDLPNQPSVDHGGFAYLFHEDVYANHPMDRYFPVVSGEQYRPAQGVDEQSTRAFDLVQDLMLLDAVRRGSNLSRSSSFNAGDVDVAAVQARVESAQAPCVVCLQAERSTILLNCGHLCCCATCAEQLTTCPICRVQIQDRRRAYT